MRRLLTWATAAALPALLVGALTVGCSGSNEKTEPEKPAETKPGKTKPGALTAVESTGKGTLKGKVKLAGAKPDFKAENEKLLAEMKAKDAAHCVEGASPEQLEQQHWRVAADGGLANVFVWIQPPDGKFFKIDAGDITADMKKDRVLDQPRCAFEPHAFVLFPSHRDPANPKKLIETGQKLVIKNSNQTAHNTDLNGGDDNPESNNQIPAGGALPPKVLNPSSHEVDFKCTIHPWMNAYARVYDHPYATVTDKDGNFEIKNVPAGAEVNLFAWHELGGMSKETGKKGKAITLKPEANSFDFTIEKP
jgi:hypothetical protein